jgi:WD40 repeat protein
VQTGECQHALEGHSDAVSSVVFSPDGRRVALGLCDNTVRVWDVVKGVEILCHQSGTSINTVEFSTDGSSLLVSG